MPQFHELANAFPLLTGEAFDELVADIKAHGQLEPIVMHEGKVLDGRNRWRATQALGVEPTEETLPKGVDPVAYVWSKNAVRRQLTPSQRAMAATKLTTSKVGANQYSEATTIQQAADLAGVGEKSVRRAKQVIDKGAPEVVQAVEAGDLSVRTAVEIAEKPVETQRKLMEKGADEAAKVVSIERARTRTPSAPKSNGPGRGSVGPKVTMTRQMEGSSAEGSKARTAFWIEHRDLIKDLDTDLLDRYVADLAAERRAIEQQLKVIRDARAGAKEPGTTTATGAKTTTATPGSPAAKKTVAKKATAAKTPAAPRKSAAAKKAAAPKTTSAPKAGSSDPKLADTPTGRRIAAAKTAAVTKVAENDKES